MTTPETSIEFVIEWFERAAKNAEAQKRHDSATLWRDGLQHIKSLAEQRDDLLAAIEQARLRLRAIGTVGEYLGKDTILRDSALEMFERCVGEAERAAK